MNNRILNKEEIYLRLIEEEYSNQLSRKNPTPDSIMSFKTIFKSKITQIILDETRKPIDFDIKIITSAELEIGLESGYDGTAIYISSENHKSAGELYIISQGSQDIKDWEYNAKSMPSSDLQYKK